MDPRSVVARRFEIVELAGSGGMGDVYRARDLSTGDCVALKILRDHGGEQTARFSREAEVLAELSHPGIVRYVAHGTSSAGLYLAMEWLEGESLAARLKRQGLTLDETLALARRVAEALGHAHRRGVVHRDLKPSNLFLVSNDPAKTKIVDFGIARLRQHSLGLTVTGAMLGTPGYMAPEQARGDKDIDARVDVFALGCVLFKCLTGRAAFSGEDGLAVLLRVVLEDAPRVSDVVRHVPPTLDALVARMLAKDATDRPPDGFAVAAALSEIGETSGASPVRSSTSPPALTTTERRVTCLIVARVAGEAALPVAPAPKAGEDLDGPTIRAAPEAASTNAEPMTMELDPSSSTWVEIVPVVADWAERERALRAVAERHGAKMSLMADGSLLVTMSSTEDPPGSRDEPHRATHAPSPATDQAARAARCALAMRPLLPGVPMALVAGHAVLSRRVPIGEVIDRAVGLLGVPERAEPKSGIRLDDVVAGLLDARFDVGGDGRGLVLRGTRDVTEATRTLFGKPSPCVGREREIASLEAMFEECAEEPMACAAVVTAPAGVGKSRVRFELLARLAARGRRHEVWFGRGDPMSAGSPWGMIARAVQRTAGLLDGEPLEVKRKKLFARVSRHVGSADRARVTEFIGEMIGVRFDDANNVQLRAARKDAMLMGDQIRRAWEDWLAAECSAQPVMIVLEDLQWGDVPSVRLVDSALRNLKNLPLFVLALGRPEIHDAFPKLWAGRSVTRVELGELSRRGSERLVREVLGASVDDATVARICERAGGNAFFLEELMRAVVEGRGDALPETVLGMVEARLAQLPPDARRVLRAASVFGQIFWLGGVTALLGGAQSSVDVGEWLAELNEREVIAPRGEGKFPGEDEHIFRHALLREAAYAMLTDQDRALGHRLAGAWLEGAGETDALVLAEHFERGGEPSRAATWYRRAAEQALGGNDFAGARARAERAIAAGATGEDLGALRLLMAESFGWQGDNAEAERAATQAMHALPRGTALWYAAAGHAALASGRLGNAARLAAIAKELASLPDQSGPAVAAAAHTAGQLLYAGQPERAEALLARLDAFERAGGDADPSVWGWVHSTRATQALFAGDPADYLARRRAAAERFEEAGDLRNGCAQRVSVGYAYLTLGAYAEAEVALGDALAQAERMALSGPAALARHNLGLAVALLGRPEEGRRLEEEAAEAFVAQGNRRNEGGARLYLALILLLMRELDRADEEARLAVVVSSPTPPGRAHALAGLAMVKLARGATADALDAAREAMMLLESLGGIDEGESLVRLAWAEALAVSGDREGARRAIAVAHDRLVERASKIKDPAWRESFLMRVPENARTLELFRSFCQRP